MKYLFTTLIILFEFLNLPKIYAQQNSSGNLNLWGITTKGGNGSIGTIYQTDNNGNNQTLIHQFDAVFAGSKPTGDLIEVGGKLYGFTSEGGTSNNGVLFSYDLATSVYTVVFNFDGAVNGSRPRGKLLLASDGLLYGLTSRGGLNDGGTIISYNISSNSVSKLYDFTFAEGIEPCGGFVEHSNGELYGLTYRGGTNDKGVIFKFTISGAVYQSLFNFNTLNGENPWGSLLKTPNGYLLGTTSGGGLNSLGVIFGYRVSTATFTKHYDFDAISGGNSVCSLVLNNSTQECFGTNYSGGVNNQGTIFKIDTAGTNYVKIYDFNQLSGGHPQGSLILRNSSVLMGTTFDGGPGSNGVAFTINTDGSGYSFPGIFDFYILGSSCSSSFLRTSNDKYYCLVNSGGNTSNGTLVMADTNATMNLTQVFSFNSAGENGGFPIGGIIKANNGKIYGTTNKGGANNFGIAYELDNLGSNFTKLADFNSAGGSDPRGSLVETSTGKLLGLSYSGGTFNFGSIYEIDPSLPSPSSPAQKVAFSSGLGTYPIGSLKRANNGKYYGLTTSGGANNNGVLFEYNAQTNSFVKRHEFASGTSGSSPSGDLIQAPNGCLYGLTSGGGVNGGGVIFKYNPIDSSFQKVFDFSNSNGISPQGALVFNQLNNKMYGLTNSGGNSSLGVLFSFDYLTNNYTKLFDFGGLNGENPTGKLILSDNGNLYGTCKFGGTNNLGVFFQFNTSTNTFTKKFDFNSVNGAEAPSELLLLNCVAPEITTQPSSINSCPNNLISFSVVSSGTGLSYQWYKNGLPIVGQTSSSLSFTSVIASDTGIYHCYIQNACGMALSNFVKLKVVSKPASSVNIFGPSEFCQGSFNTELSTVYNPNYTYQWNLNGSPISGFTSNLFYPNISGQYSVTVSSGVGCDSTSTSVPITVVASITVQPIVSISANEVVCGPMNVVFTADTSNIGIDPYCVWKKNGFPIPGAAGLNLLTYSGTLSNNNVITLSIIPNLCPSDEVISNSITIVDTCATLTINIGNIGSSTFCAGQSISVPYQASSNFLSNNFLTLQLSDATGSFSNPTIITTLNTISSNGVINGIIPSNVIRGNAYRIRIVASAPANVSNDNGANLYISSQHFGLSYTISPGTTLTAQPFNATFTNTTPQASNYTFDWHFGDGTFVNNAPINYMHVYLYNGVFQTAMVAIDTVSGCSDTLYDPNNANHKVICNDPNLPNCNQLVNVSPNGVINSCIGGNVVLTCNNFPNYSYQWSRNGVLLPGQNTNQIQVQQGGFYSVIVFNADSCPVSSSPVQVNFTGASPTPPIISFSNGGTNNCGNSNGTLFATGSFANYLWSNGQSGNSININSAGTYTVIGQGALGCDAISNPFVVLGSPLDIPEICTVTSLEDDSHHIIIWNKPLNTLIDSFIIMKDSSNLGNFYRIGAVDYADLSEFIDLSSHPQLGASTYSVVAKDVCGGYSLPSSPVRPIFLQVQTNIGIKRWLNWNQYISQTQNISQYVIYRGYSLSELDSVTTINAPINGYLDNPPGIDFVYRVEAILSTPCEATRAARGRSYSNGNGNLLMGPPDTIDVRIKEIDGIFNNMSIIPNPNNGVFKIVTETNTEGVLKLFDITGKLHMQQYLYNNNSWIVNSKDLDKGIYLLNFSGKDFTIQKKVIIQ